MANGKGHFGPTDRNDQTGHSGPPSKLFPNIPVGLNRNGSFHLMYQPKLPEFCVEWKAPIGSELNPADEVSRGLTVEEMCANSKWLNSPQFLTKKDEFWPLDPTLHESEVSDDDPEIKRA